MKKATITDVGLGGMNSDISAWNLPSSMFTWAKNVRCYNNAIGNIKCGRTEWKADVGNPALDLIYCSTRGSSGFWVAAKTDKISTIDGDDLITGYSTDYWVSDICSGVPVWASFTVAPLYWSDVDILTPLSKLPWDATHDWDDTDGTGNQYRAAVIRKHGTQLIAIDVAEGANPIDLVSDRLPRTVHWSEFADEGLPPADWDYSNPNSNSGRKDLSETPGRAVDGLSLGEIFMLYKSDAGYRFTPVNNENVFDIKRVKKLPGILARNCVAEFQGFHYVTGPNDIYRTEGNSFESLLDQRMREYFLSILDSSKSEQNFVRVNYAFKEIWFCFSVAGSGVNYATIAMVYSVPSNTWTIRDLPNLSALASGPKETSGEELINDVNVLINDSTRLINQITNIPTNLSLIGAISDNSITEFDTGPDNDGIAFESRLTRDFIQIDDEVMFNTTDRGYPHFNWISGMDSELEIRIGSHRSTQDAVRWRSWKSFDIKTRRHVGMRANGAFHAMDIRSTNSLEWSYTGIMFEYENSGDR